MHKSIINIWNNKQEAKLLKNQLKEEKEKLQIETLKDTLFEKTKPIVDSLRNMGFSVCEKCSLVVREERVSYIVVGPDKGVYELWVNSKGGHGLKRI